MSAFHVGQRVRIKFAKNYPYFVGCEATICGVWKTIGWMLDIDGYGAISPVGKEWGAKSEWLEPLTDSNDLVSWESMRDLWVPEHLRVKA